MRFTHLLAVFVAITVAGCTRTPPPPVRTEIVEELRAEELPPTVCWLQKNGDTLDGQETFAMGTLYLDTEYAMLGDAHCPSVRVVLTRKTDGVDFLSLGDGVLVRLFGTYHRGQVGRLEVTSIEAWDRTGTVRSGP